MNEKTGSNSDHQDQVREKGINKRERQKTEAKGERIGNTTCMNLPDKINYKVVITLKIN